VQTLGIFYSGRAFFEPHQMFHSQERLLCSSLCKATPFGHVFGRLVCGQETLLKGVLFTKNFSISGLSYKKIEAASCF
jgi:hypothetical protein